MATISAQTIQSINPATKQIICEVPVFSEAKVEEAVSNAWHAFSHWQSTDYAYRAKKLEDFRRVLVREADSVSALVTKEVGKPIVESYLAELSGPLDCCLYLAKNTEQILQEQAIHFANPLLFSKRSLITFPPLGVIGVIAPWNYPFSIPTMTILAALMVGNTVVLKPSENSSLIGMKIGELFQEAGFPEGCVSVVTGDRRTGQALTNCKLSKIIFTGSMVSGTNVMIQAAPNVIPLSLELGGVDPAIVLPDAPPDWTAKGLVWGSFTNAGQACASIERVYLVKGKNTNSLLERIEFYTRQLKIGPPTDPRTEIGPLINETQLLKVAERVDQAHSSGASVICGGKRRDDLGGYFYEPTVLTNVNHTMSVMTDETFGPVMPIMVVDSEGEAVSLANDSEFGLTASVWSPDLPRAGTLARRLNVGTVFVNDCLFSHASPQVPWGGLKKSGFGRSHGQFGLLDLVNIKQICTDAAGGANRIWWFPYGPTRVNTARGGIAFLHGSSLAKRIYGLAEFTGNLFKKDSRER